MLPETQPGPCPVPHLLHPKASDSFPPGAVKPSPSEGLPATQRHGMVQMKRDPGMVKLGTMGAWTNLTPPKKKPT